MPREFKAPQAFTDKAEKALFALRRSTGLDRDADEAQEVAIFAITAALAAPEPQQCRSDGRCQYVIDSGAEGMGHCPPGKCCMPMPEPQPLTIEEVWASDEIMAANATIGLAMPQLMDLVCAVQAALKARAGA